MVLDPVIALETLISLGFQRVLTSGCDTSALEGLPLIKRLIDQVSLNYTYDFTPACHIGAVSLFSSPSVSLNRPKGELSLCRVSFLFLSFFFRFVCLLLMLFKKLLIMTFIYYRRGDHREKSAENFRGVRHSRVSLLGPLE